MKEPTPDEVCSHVALGVEMTGGWLFAANDPPIAVGMCHECILWCRDHLSKGLSFDKWTALSNDVKAKVLSSLLN